MNPRLFEKIKINAQRFVNTGVGQYEKDFGRFEVDAIKQKFLDNALSIVLRIVDRVSENEEISIIPIREVLLKALFELDFDSEAFTNVYSVINSEIVSFIKSEPNYDANIVRSFDSYNELIVENAADYTFYSGSSVTNILQNQPEYQYSDILTSLYPLEVFDKKVYTLFPKERYWEVFLGTPADGRYSPVSYNRVASAAGFSQYKIDFSYDDLVIYNGELYKLKPGVTPSQDIFNNEEWIKYSPRRFDKSKSFNSVYLSKVRSIFGKIADDGFDINSIISDSHVSRYLDPNSRVNSSPDDFVSSFGGKGKQLLKTIEQVELLSNSLGGYEGSFVGGLEYISEFIGHLLLASFGRNVPEDEDVVSGISIFGKFNLLFASKTSLNKIPGLKFLDGFAKLKSFVHNQSVSFDTNNQDRVVYNPVYEQFLSGIADKFKSLEPVSSYSEDAKVDLLLYSLESLLRRCSNIGDLIQAGISSLNTRGQTPGYEGLGSVEIQLRNFQRVFPPSRFFFDLPPDVKIGPGLTGVIRYFLNNYSKFSKEVINPIFPGRSLEFLLPWVESINNRLEEVVSLIEEIGIETGSFIPNLSFKTFIYKEDAMVNFLASLGFRDSEIEQLLNIQDFNQLITKFAPLSNSSDLKSFFKAYELAQLIYEIGGDSGINSYLSFLYSPSSLDSLLNILELSQKEKSTATYVNLTKFPKLIGLLIGLTYAIDPNQLVKFNKILGANSLSLLESISFLLQQGEETIIKLPQSIQLLSPVIDQIISGVYEQDSLSSPSLNYSQANSLVPIGLKQWTSLVGDNLGKIDSEAVIHQLYDRSIGLTPRELISILNAPDSPNSFGALVDGFSGGEFTTFLKYVNLTGLGFKLGFYKNSYQVNNFEIGSRAKGSFLPNLLLEIKSLVESFSIFKTVFDSSLDYNFKYDVGLVRDLEVLVKAQNKSFEIIPTLIEEKSKGESLEQLQLLASDFKIVESPGIGNSRLPNRIPVVNSITPDQADVLLNEQRGLLELTTVTQENLSAITNFIKFSQENRLANAIQTTEEVSKKIEADSRTRSYVPKTDYEINITLEQIENETSLTPKQYQVSKLYENLPQGSEIKSSGLGANYLTSPPAVVDSSTIKFDPVESCKRFGGSGCEELYSEVADRCSGVINKSLFPEEYLSIPGVSSTAVVIDRPLGTFANYVPSTNVVPVSSFTTPPQFFSLLPADAIPGKKGEPILTTVFSTPLVFEKGGRGGVSEYDNTEFGLVEFIRAKLEKNSEFGCASFESPFYYQACMNIMKCKRFVPPTLGKNYIDFCPKTISGGREK
jgi:hypothetical protein